MSAAVCSEHLNLCGVPFRAFFFATSYPVQSAAFEQSKAHIFSAISASTPSKKAEEASAIFLWREGGKTVLPSLWAQHPATESHRYSGTRGGDWPVAVSDAGVGASVGANVQNGAHSGHPEHALSFQPHLFAHVVSTPFVFLCVLHHLSHRPSGGAAGRAIVTVVAAAS